MSVYVEWRQHAVGHGGLHTGFAVADGHRLTWMYDCGSRSGVRFDDYLVGWLGTNREPIDWLFVSHFDKDHVSGLRTLMANAIVRTVMLPYVDERELVLMLLEEIARDNVDRELFGLAADPAGYFLARGAERVIVVSPGGPDEPGVSESPGSAPPSEGGWTERAKPPTEPLWGSVGEDRWRRGQPWHPVRRMVAGGSISVERAGFAMRFVPYRAPVAALAHRSLLHELRRLVSPNIGRRRMRMGLGQLAYTVALHARTREGRADLKALYAAHAGSSNRASMSLSSTPVLFGQERGQVSVSVWGGFRRDFGQALGTMPVWLNTGDAELLDPNDLADWNATYANQLRDVRVLSLPHHGSDRNSNRTLQDLCSPDAVFTAHAKAGARKHPGGAVSAAAGTRLSTVTWAPATAVSMHLWAS